MTSRASASAVAGASSATAYLTSPQAGAVLAAIGQVEAGPEETWTDEEWEALGRARDKVQGAAEAASGRHVTVSLSQAEASAVLTVIGEVGAAPGETWTAARWRVLLNARRRIAAGTARRG